MENKDITYSDVSRSLNRLEGFIDDFLLTVQSYNEKRNIEKINVIVDGHNKTMQIYPIDIKKSIIGFIDDVKFNREGDESINYFGIRDCVDYILNNQSLLLAKRAFSIETKIKESESILTSFIADVKEANDLLWETGQILWQIGELHIEPFIQDDGDDSKDYPEIPNELIWLFPSESQCIDFVKNNWRKPANIVANAYMEESRVVDPFIKNNSLHARSTLYHYFVEPFDKSDSARTGFYKLFK